MNMKRALGLSTVVAFAAACGAQGPVASADDDDGSTGTSDSSGTGSFVTVGAGTGGAGTSTGPGATTGSGGSTPTGIPVLGNGQHTANSVQIATIANSADGLNEPRDVAFHPTRSGELWVVNRADDSMTVLVGASSGSPTPKNFWDSSGGHFMAEPSALAFGSNGNLATIHESDTATQGGTPGDFMGPTMWTSNLSVFDAGHYGHLDMLHNSPNGMGIAWETGNTYWVFDGYHSSITRYEFNGDHGPGGSDHSDGEIARYVEGKVKRSANVPSHMELSGTSLYIADTGNSRVAVLDITSGSDGSGISPNYDGVYQYAVNSASLTTLIEGASIGLSKPSGLALHGGYLFVSDNATGTIHGFTMEGAHVDYLETGRPAGSLMGIAFDEAGRLYVADGLADEVLQISETP
ncbi:hypothetical protein JYT28_00300 [Desulfobulbus sp. AH-315-M07]|nr:hypothetical protein [Desulfobulbus sp. AH-315-M07]